MPSSSGSRSACWRRRPDGRRDHPAAFDLLYASSHRVHVDHAAQVPAQLALGAELAVDRHPREVEDVELIGKRSGSSKRARDLGAVVA